MIDLTIPFDNRERTPYYEQIYSYIKSAIREGHIQAGERLPSTRQLAQKLGVSRSTTQLAYDQLCAEGYLEARPYRGYYAAKMEDLYLQPGNGAAHGRMTRSTDLSNHNSLQMLTAPEVSKDTSYPRTFGSTQEENIREESASPEASSIDFSPRGIDLGHFPFRIWRKLSRDVLQDENREIFASGDNQGEWELRQAICDYLRGSRSILCHPGQVVVGAGTEYLLMLLTQLIGIRCIAMENPTYRQASLVMARLGHQILPGDTGAQGMQTRQLEGSGADLVYTMPSHQFPTGTVLSAPRRQQILRWAMEDERRFIIEDDYDSEFRYRGKPIPSLAGSDTGERVIYLGTFSKAVAPAIRVSYMVLPMSLALRYPEVCGFYTSTVSRIDQMILSRFMEQGYFERHLNRMRGIYRTKHDLLLDALEDFRGAFRISGEMAGLHVLLESVEGRREEELQNLAEQAGVQVYPLSSYYLKPDVSRTVLLGYANLTEEEILEGVHRLREAWLESAGNE